MPAGSDYRHMRTGSLTIPHPQNGHGGHATAATNGSDGVGVNGNGMNGAMAGGMNHRFEGPRSPPNTSHVPCKFFRQGACQAGNACPFSHDIGLAAETVCKYFAKGNCKFGPKCANVHVLPDGRRINYGRNGVTIGGQSTIDLGTRVNPTAYNHHPSNSALTDSFLGRQANNSYAVTSPYAVPHDDRYASQHHLGRQPSLEGNGLPTIDTTYSSIPTSTYGSPRDDDASSRFGLGLSPSAKGLSVLDAPLPASFDSNGISHAARYGPWPSSVPSKFGLDSPSPSLHASDTPGGRASETLKSLHHSAFGSSEHLSPSALPSAALAGEDNLLFGSSLNGGKRITSLHSSSMRYRAPRMLSSSAPRGIERDWDPDFLFEEDYVPGALANEVLTPAEKARRGSTNTLRGDDSDNIPLGSSLASSAKIGSPMATGSPSRWGPLFQRQKDEEDGGLGSRKHGPSAFGHVGSPLRNSSLATYGELNGSLSGSLNGRSGSIGGKMNGEISVLSQQLRRTQLVSSEEQSAANGSANGTSGSSSPHMHPSTSSHPPNALNGLRGSGLERHVSSGSISNGSHGRLPVDEDSDAAFVFSMEEEDDLRNGHANCTARKRISSGASPLGGAVWSYANVAGGVNGAGGGGRDATKGTVVEGVGGR